MALNIPTEGTKLNELKINIVDTQATFEAMKTANKVNANELYFIEQELPIIADSLKTGHTFKVNLASENASTAFNGTADITDIGVSGALPVKHGGTGFTTATYKNAVVIGNSSTVTNQLQTIRTASGAFYATGQDAKPSFGTLPIAQGGTGATSAANARTNLGLGTMATETAANYLKLAGGTMTGGVTFVGNQSSAWNDKGILFTNGSRIGENSSKALGLYSASTFYIRPDSGTASSGKGLEISSTAMIPSVNNEMDLGSSDKKFKAIYATTLNGNLAWSNITSKPTTLSGYGITDAKINNGTITLGNNSITPLTSHQTVSNKGATLVWGSATAIATIGSTDIKVSLPANPNTDTKVTSVDNHYAPTANTNSELTATLSGTAGNYTINTEYTVLTGVKAQRDAKGHVTGLTYTAQKIKDTNTTYTLANLVGSTVIGSATKPIYWNGSKFDTITSYEGNASTATTASKLSNTAKIGDTNKPVYFTASGVPIAINYSINKDVPSDAVFTDTKVTQNNVTASNDYRVLLSASANDTAETNTVNKNANLRYNPSTNTLSTGNISSAGNLTITGNTNLNGETYAESVTAGSLLVNGNTNFVQIPTAPTPATTSNDTSIATTAFVKNNLGGLSGAMHFKGTTTTALNDGTTTAAVTIGGNSYTPSAGDVVLYSDSEFVWTGSAWERLGRDSSFKVQQSAVTTATAETTTATIFVHSVTQDANGVITVKTRPLPTYNNYSLPLAKDGTRGGIQIGYAQSGQNYPVQLSSEKAYVNVPWTDTKNTAGSTDTSSKIYLIGATSQADNPQTYSDSEVYVQNGSLYLVRNQDASGTANNKPALIVGGADTATHMEIDANEIQAKSNGTTTAALYLNNDGGLVTVGSGGLTINSLTASQAISTDANKKLVSTNLTVSDPTANGTGITYIDTISQNATGKITATKSTVRSASTSQTGVTQYTEANTNTQLSTLTTTWTATPTDDTLFIRRDTGGGATFGQVKFSTLWNYIKGKITAGTYWANIKISDAAVYNAAPEMATLKLNGNTGATAASTSNVSLIYNSTTQALNFVFA